MRLRTNLGLGNKRVRLGPTRLDLPVYSVDQLCFDQPRSVWECDVVNTGIISPALLLGRGLKYILHLDRTSSGNGS